MHQSENIKIKLITMINKDEYSWLILLCARVNENQQLNHSQAKDISSSPNPLVKVLRRGRHRVWGLNRRRAIKEWSIAINNDWVDN